MCQQVKYMLCICIRLLKEAYSYMKFLCPIGPPHYQ